MYIRIRSTKKLKSKISNQTKLRIILQIHLIRFLSCILNAHQRICHPIDTTEIPSLTSHTLYVANYITRTCAHVI